MKKCMRSYFPYLVTANLQAMNTQTSGLLPTRNRADLALEVSSDSFQESRWVRSRGSGRWRTKVVTHAGYYGTRVTAILT